MIIGLPHPPAKGGPGSFQLRLEKALTNRGWRVVYPEDRISPDVILVVGGTRKLWWLFKNKKKGIPIIHRLAGLNWMYRIRPYNFSTRTVMKLQNVLMRLIRYYFANAVIYQSSFVKKWWISETGAAAPQEYIIYNGVSLEEFSPLKKQCIRIPLICVEGNIDYSPNTTSLLNYLAENLTDESMFGGIYLYGGSFDPSFRTKLAPEIIYKGEIPHNRIHIVYQNSIFLSLDLNAACPNSAIEALACGAPVIGFDTGALRELVPKKAGILVPYGTDPWKLGIPDFEGLADAAQTVFRNWRRYSHGARSAAEKQLGIEDMTNAYLRVFSQTIAEKKYSCIEKH